MNLYKPNTGVFWSEKREFQILKLMGFFKLFLKTLDIPAQDLGLTNSL